MIKVYSFATFLLLCIFTNTGIKDIKGQVSISLDHEVRPFDSHYFGYNGRSTEGPTWDNEAFLTLVEKMNPGTVRYPAGTQANYWNWRTGTFIAETGKTTRFNFPLDTFIMGLPERSQIIYVANIARPTPVTGVSVHASEDELKSDATLQLKIDDILAALEDFERLGRFPEVLELGNEFYFDSEHGSIYAINPDLYLNHCKKLCLQVKEKYPELKILLITSKAGNGSSNRDVWNNKVFETLEADAEFANMVHGVVQHHYISSYWGDQTMVSDEATAKVAMAEGIMYPREKKSDYDMVPEGIELWITEYGATKENADNTWTAGLRAVAMSLGWLDLGDKISRLLYHHITDENMVINKNEMKLASIGMAYGLLTEASLGANRIQKIEISNNPFIYSNVEALHAYKFIGDSTSTLFILNIGEQSHENVTLSNVIKGSSKFELKQIWSENTYSQPVYEEQGVEFESGLIENTVTIKPYSVLTIKAKNDSLVSVFSKNSAKQSKVYPTMFSNYLNIEISAKYNNAKALFFNVSGKLHKCYDLNNKENSLNTSFDSGVYFIKIVYPDHVETFKTIKTN